jgi:hypothetical protein
MGKIPKQTVREFDFGDDVTMIVDSWAQEAGYRKKESDSAGSVYQKGHGFWVAPMMVEVGQAGSRVTLKAWIRTNLFTRIGALFMIPKSMGVESGGFKLALPRKIARGKVNQLLEKLGQPPIP